MSKQFIQPKGVSFLDYAIFFDKGSFVFDFIKGVLFFKILNSRKSAFFPGRILLQTSPDKWPGGGVGEDERVKKETLHDKGSFIFQKTEKNKYNEASKQNTHFLMIFYARKGETFWKIWETLLRFVLFSAMAESHRCKNKMAFALIKGVSFFKIYNTVSENIENVFWITIVAELKSWEAENCSITHCI